MRVITTAILREKLEEIESEIQEAQSEVDCFQEWINETRVKLEVLQAQREALTADLAEEVE